VSLELLDISNNSYSQRIRDKCCLLRSPMKTLPHVPVSQLIVEALEFAVPAQTSAFNLLICAIASMTVAIKKTKTSCSAWISPVLNISKQLIFWLKYGLAFAVRVGVAFQRPGFVMATQIVEPTPGTKVTRIVQMRQANVSVLASIFISVRMESVFREL
jgi:hypothetical protein